MRRTSSRLSASATLCERSSSSSISWNFSKLSAALDGTFFRGAAMEGLQLVAQQSDGLFQESVLVTRAAAQFLQLRGMRFAHSLHLLSQGTDGCGELLDIVVSAGG